MNDSDINQQQLEEQIAQSLEGMSVDEIRNVFIESLIFGKLGDDEEIDDDVVAELKTDLNDRLDGKINEKISEALPESEIGKLDDLIASGAGSEEIREFVSQNGVDIDKLVTDAMQELRDEFVGSDEE